MFLELSCSPETCGCPWSQRNFISVSGIEWGCIYLLEVLSHSFSSHFPSWIQTVLTSLSFPAPCYSKIPGWNEFPISAVAVLAEGERAVPLCAAGKATRSDCPSLPAFPSHLCWWVFAPAVEWKGLSQAEWEEGGLCHLTAIKAWRCDASLFSRSTQFVFDA